MNVSMETTIAIQTLDAAIIKDHLVALVILASLEMEPIVKVCSMNKCQELCDIFFPYLKGTKALI